MKKKTVLQRIRVERKLTQRQLADRAGIAANYLGLLETGRIKRPGVDVAIKIADALGVTVQDLFGEAA